MPFRENPQAVVELGEIKAKPDPELTRDCDKPNKLPHRALSAGEVTRYWAVDRARLVECGDRHHAETEFYEKRDAGLANEAQ